MEKFLEKISDFFTAKNESSFELLSEKTGQFSLIEKSPIKDNKLLELNLHWIEVEILQGKINELFRSKNEQIESLKSQLKSSELSKRSSVQQLQESILKIDSAAKNPFRLKFGPQQ